MRNRTNTRSPGVVDLPPSVAKRAFRSTTDGTIRAGLRHTIIAYANVPCKNMTQ